MKPDRLLCYVFLLAFLDLTVYNSIAIILNLLTNKNIALIYSVTICELKTTDCARLGSFRHKPLFSTVMFAGFPNKSPLLTMARRDDFILIQ